MKIFSDQLGFPEAPVFLPDDSLLCVQMSPQTGCVTHISKDGKSHRVVARTGRPNGLARDSRGAIWVAETAMRAVLRMKLEGGYEAFVRECDGEPFLFLNDLAFAPNGQLYVTDSGILIDEVAPGGELAPNYRSLRYDGRVYRIDTRTAQIELIDRGFQFTNGVAVDPEGHLYVTETLTGNIYKYGCREGRVVGKRELFANVIERFDPAELKGPDGMKFGQDGNLYVAVFGQGDVTVLDRHGKAIERIKTRGAHPTNLSFAPRGAKQIYVTEVDTGSIQVLNVATAGFPLYD